MNWRPITLRCHSAAEVRVTNQLLHGSDGRFQLGLQDRKYEIRLGHGHDYPATVALECRVGDASVSIHLSDDALGKLLRNTIRPSFFRTLPEDLQLALSSAAIFPLADFLNAQVGIALETERCESLVVDTLSSGLLLEAALPDSAATIQVLLAIDNALPGKLVEWLQQSRKTSSAQELIRDYEWLTFPVMLQAGRTSLKVSDVESLEFGDIILMDIAYLAKRRLRISMGDTFACLGQLHGDTLTVRGAWEKTLSIEEEPTGEAGAATKVAVPEGTGDDPRNDASPALDTADLPVDVLFIAGQFTIPLKELKSIQPGYVFDLQKDARSEIEIRANGTGIARGELVEVDGRTGVRVIDFKHG